MSRSLKYSIAAFCAVLFFTQGQWVSSAAAQAVQLPTFEYTHVNTTVSVPDRGGAYLGGVNRASAGSSTSGTPVLPFRNRSYGQSTTAGGMSVGVYVHDFEAMEAGLMNDTMRSYGGQPAARNSNLMNVQDNVLMRQAQQREMPATAKADYSLGGRANRALTARRETETPKELNLAATEPAVKAVKPAPVRKAPARKAPQSAY